jgi:transcription elongation factor GreA
MAGIALSPGVHSRLVKQLAELEERKAHLVDDFYPLPTREREEFARLLDEYLQRIEALVTSAAPQETCSDNSVPFVTIDCAVEVKNLDNGQTFNWQVVIPTESKVGKGCVSCFSPVGKSLLLRKAGETITVSAPRGIARYQVLSAVMN